MNALSKLTRSYRLYRLTRKALTKAVRQPVFVEKLGYRFAAENGQMQTGDFEPEETALLAVMLDDVEVFLNIGANVGYYCCMALQRGKQCIAVEPIYDNLQLLQKNLVANDWGQGVKVFPVAASDHDGISTIYGEGTGASMVEGWAGSFDARYVPTLKIDSMLAAGPSGRMLVLMDIEGHELAALRGATQLVAQRSPKPVWIVEISIDEHWPQDSGMNPRLLETFEVFWSNGYRSFAANTSLREVCKAELNSIRETHANTLRTHNFLFSDQSDAYIDALRHRLVRR